MNYFYQFFLKIIDLSITLSSESSIAVSSEASLFWQSDCQKQPCPPRAGYNYTITKFLSLNQ